MSNETYKYFRYMLLQTELRIELSFKPSTVFTPQLSQYCGAPFPGQALSAGHKMRISARLKLTQMFCRYRCSCVDGLRRQVGCPENTTRDTFTWEIRRGPWKETTDWTLKNKEG